MRLGTVVAAIAAVLFVFNAAGDWFLLGIALSFLLGLGWVAIKAIPQFSKQITLVLNMGAVREGECVNFDGVLWKVETLGFTVVLNNDRLDGGEQHLPVRMLANLHSRPRGENENLFPTRTGDWARLEDGTVGCIESQTTTAVKMKLRIAASWIPAMPADGLSPSRS